MSPAFRRCAQASKTTPGRCNRVVQIANAQTACTAELRIQADGAVSVPASVAYDPTERTAKPARRVGCAAATDSVTATVASSREPEFESRDPASAGRPYPPIRGTPPTRSVDETISARPVSRAARILVCAWMLRVPIVAGLPHQERFCLATETKIACLRKHTAAALVAARQEAAHSEVRHVIYRSVYSSRCARATARHTRIGASLSTMGRVLTTRACAP